MTIEEAINKLQLKLNLENELVDQNMDFASAIKIEAGKKFILSRIKKGQENAEVFRIAIEALEKQIPKKANGGHCPLCGEMLFWEGRVLLPTCPCGQKIDWSEENDDR